MDPPSTPGTNNSGNPATANSGRKKPQSDSKKPTGRVLNAELRALCSDVADQIASDQQLLLVTLWENGVDAEVWDDAERLCSNLLEHVRKTLERIDMPHNWQSELPLSCEDELQSELRNVICATAAHEQHGVKEFVRLCCSFAHEEVQSCIHALLASVQNDAAHTSTTAAPPIATNGYDEDAQQSQLALQVALLDLQQLCASSPYECLTGAICRLQQDCEAVAKELLSAGDDERVRNLASLSDECTRMYRLGKFGKELKLRTNGFSTTTNLVMEAINEEVSESSVVHEANGVTLLSTYTTQSTIATANVVTTNAPCTPSAIRRSSTAGVLDPQAQSTTISALQAAVVSVESPFYDAFLKLVDLLQNHTPSKVWGEFSTVGSANEVMDSFITLVLGSSCRDAVVVKRKSLARFGRFQSLHHQFTRVFRSAGVVPRPITTAAMDVFRGNEAACRGLVDAVLQHLVLEVQQQYPHAGIYYLPECGVTEGNGRPVDYMIFCRGKLIALVEVKADSRYRNAVSESATSSSMNASWAQLLAYAEQSSCDRDVELFLCATTGLLWQSAVYNRMIPAIQRGTVEDIFLVQDHVPRQTMNGLFAFIVDHVVQCLDLR